MSQEQDDRVLALQIGRPLRALSSVRASCSLGLPIVAAVPPVLDTGEPFPTRYWLTCPLARRRIARLEAGGGVRAVQKRVDDDVSFRAALAEVHRRYERDRSALIPEGARHVPRGGVGGSSGGVKCLHAHYADYVAGNENPIGMDVARQIGEPRCEVPCVAEVEGELAKNPDWREPGA
ncbi:MAG: DUF501 domain-containing protein [Myxococcota bacterium]